MSLSADSCALSALVQHTDVCISVLSCPEELLARIKSTGCDTLSAAAIRTLQSLFGTVRRTYRPFLELHPSLPLDLGALLRHRSHRLPVRAVDVVLSRCKEPLTPLLRLLPAALPRHSQLRVFVYERCGGERATSLDLRDGLFGLTRHALPRGAAQDAHAFSTHLELHGGDAAATTLFLRTRTLAALVPAALTIADAPPRAPSRRGTDAALQALISDLRATWRPLQQPVSWSTAGGAEAALANCVVTALRRTAAATTTATGADVTAVAPVIRLSGAANRTVGVVATQAAVQGVRGARGDRTGTGTGGVSAWRTLMRTAGSGRLRGTHGLPAQVCADVRPVAVAQAAAAAEAAAGSSSSSWPAAAAVRGFCGITNDGVEGDCARGDKGSWNTREHRVRSFADCAARCVACARCRYVTYAADEDDCSWYSGCALDRLGPDPAFLSVRVRHDGGAGGAERGEAALVRPSEAMRVHGAYVTALSADARWHVRLVRAALLLLLRRVAVAVAATALAAWGGGGGESAGGVGSGSGGGGEGGGSAAGMPTVDLACVEADFMLHHRQLLPSATHRCEGGADGGGGSAAAAAAAAIAKGGGRRRRLGGGGGGGAAAGGGGVGGAGGVGGVGGGASLSAADASAVLSALLDRAHARAAGTGDCREHGLVRQEMHLSGFFSMLAGSLKAWTAALRTRRAFLTPKARGLIDPRQCGGANDLSCWFEPVGPPRCEHQWGAPQLVFNLPQLHRESLAAAQAIPAPFAPLGSFWWASQYVARMMRPSARLRRLVDEAAAASGLAQALGAGEAVAGFHVRHGDSCLPEEEARTARRCEPLAKYVDAVEPYLRRHGVAHVFLATDSEVVVRDAAAIGAARGLTFHVMPNVSRTGLTTPNPTEVLDKRIKARAARGGGAVARTHTDALLGIVDAMLLARCHVLVGKFTSGLFRAAYMLSATHAGHRLRPFVSLDAPWCADYGVVSGYNDDFPRRNDPPVATHEQVEATTALPGARTRARLPVRNYHANMFQC